MIVKDNYNKLKYKIKTIINNYDNLSKDDVLIELKKCINQNKPLK